MATLAKLGITLFAADPLCATGNVF